MRKLTFTVRLSAEDDPLLEQEIAEKLELIFIHTVAMLNYRASNFAISTIEGDDDSGEYTDEWQA